MNHSDTRIISNMLQLTHQSFGHNWSINYKSSSSTIDSSTRDTPALASQLQNLHLLLKLNQSGFKINLVSGQSSAGCCSNIFSIPRVKNLFRSSSGGDFRGVEKTNPQIYLSKVYDWRSLAWWLCICGICWGEKGDYRQIGENRLPRPS